MRMELENGVCDSDTSRKSLREPESFPPSRSVTVWMMGSIFMQACHEFKSNFILVISIDTVHGTLTMSVRNL
jgi:hypothetical protein